MDRAFSRFAGTDRAIDATDLRQSLNLRGEFLAKRLVALFDRNGDGRIERDEFLDAVNRLVFGSTHEKLEFAFRIHDLDGDGRLLPGEIVQMMAMSQNEELGNETAGIESSRRRTTQLNELTKLLFAVADVDGDGALSPAEFERIIHQDPRLLDLRAQ